MSIRRAVLLMVLFAACIYRVWLVYEFNPLDSSGSTDMGRHWWLGTHPLDTQPFTVIDPVGYQLYLSILAKLTAGSRPLVFYWTALLTLLAPWCWYRFLRELLPNSPDLALFGWVLLAALPSWSAIYSYFMQETLMFPLLGSALWASWRCRRKQDLRSFLLAVGLWICVGLTRGICIPLAAVTMLWLWLEQAQKPSKALCSILMLLFILVPLAGRSWSVARVVSPHGIGALNALYSRSGALRFSIEFESTVRQSGGAVYRFQSPAPAAPTFEPFSDWRSMRRGHFEFLVDLDAGAAGWRKAGDALPPTDLARYARLTYDNLLLLFFSHSWPDTDTNRFIGQCNRWTRWLWFPLTLVCLVATIRLRHRQRERLLPALLLTWFFFQGLLALAVNEGRYRKPFEGLLVAQCLLLVASARKGTVTRAPRAALQTMEAG